MRFLKRNFAVFILMASAVLLAGCVPAGRLRTFAMDNGSIVTSSTDLDDFSDLAFLLPQLEGSRVVMYGEDPHGTRDHLEMVFRLLVFLNREAGFRYFAPELDFAYTSLLNRYLECGDPALLDEMDIWKYNNAARTRDYRELWEKLYLYNASLPHELRIRVIPADISHGLEYAIRLVWRIPGQIPDSALRAELAAILADGENQHFYALLPLIGSLEKRFLDAEKVLRPLIPDFDEKAFLIRSTHKSLEMAIRRNENGFDWDRERETMMGEYYSWHIQHAGEAPERFRVLAWVGGYHVSKTEKRTAGHVPLGTWLQGDYPFSRGRVFSIYAVALDGEYTFGGREGMKTGSIRPSGVAALMPEMRAGVKRAALFTRVPGKDGSQNPFAGIMWNGVPLGERYDLILALHNVRAAEPLP